MIASIKINLGDIATEACEFGRRGRTLITRSGGKYHPESATRIFSGDRQADV
jgi:hypothetical protein